MALKEIYDEGAESYEVADLFGSIRESHAVAIEQIRAAKLGQGRQFKVLDLGVGNGLFLKTVKELVPKASCTGIDISAKMLEKAAEALPLVTIETTATEASHFLPLHSQDLVLAHFINAYIPISSLLHQAKMLTKANGHFSMISSTYESFPVGQEKLAEFIANDSVVSRIVGHYYKGVVKNTSVALGEQDLLANLEANQFEVLRHQRLYIPIRIDTLDDLIHFGVEGTWFLNGISMRLLPKNFLIQRIKNLVHKHFHFPYYDTHIIDVVLARK